MYVEHALAIVAAAAVAFALVLAVGRALVGPLAYLAASRLGWSVAGRGRAERVGDVLAATGATGAALLVTGYEAFLPPVLFGGGLVVGYVLRRDGAGRPVERAPVAAGAVTAAAVAVGLALADSFGLAGALHPLVGGAVVLVAGLAVGGLVRATLGVAPRSRDPRHGPN